GIRQNVPVQVRHHDHVEFVWSRDQASRKVVDDELLVLDFGILRGGLLDYLPEESVRLTQHIVLGRAGELALAAGPFAPERQLAGELSDAPRIALRDHLDR